MTTLIGATEAARLLGVTKPTLYAYVSRGLIERQTAVDGRTSLYQREAIEALAASRHRARTPPERPSIDIQIGSSITHLSDDAVTYRGHDVVELARDQPFESVAELLWTGTLPGEAPAWPLDRDALSRCRAVVDAAATADPITALALAATALGDVGAAGSAVPVARRLLAIAPSLLGGPQRGTVAARLAAAHKRGPDPALVTAVDRALVLLADHELATSTLAVRVATSVRTTPAAAMACGLSTVGGRLHGRATSETVDLLRSAAAHGADHAVRRVIDHGRRLPGFGHSVYRRGDPRLRPLLDVVADLPDPADRRPTVDGVLAAAGQAITHLPNVDFGLAALHFVGDLPDDAPLFAVARIAGWAAHHDEELAERPVRYRGLTRMR